ncbi:MAG: hypothetical protein JXC36_07410 [Candidatus Atribacteria bacterium]|nr:hypothetical protein [Candidatus Atribacteria bacterium]
MSTKGIIVLGGHIQALGIVRILGRHGINALVIDNTTKNIARHSKYCIAFIKSADAEIITLLLKLGVDKKYAGWIIFPTNDYHVKLLSINKPELEKYFIVSTDKWDVVNTFYNKCNAYKLAQEINIPFPKTWYPSSEQDISPDELTFPCIVKPAVMHEFYRKVRKKVFLCRNYNELLNNYRKALKIIPAEEIIIQEIIPGSGVNQYSACFLFLNGKSFVSLTACRMRQHPIDFGNATTYAEVVEVPEILVYAEKLLGTAKYNGLCEVEFKRDIRDGVFKFLEVNTRTWKWHAIANKAGTPFLKSYYDMLNGKTINSVKGFTKASFLHVLTDIPVRLQLLLKGHKHWNRKIKPCENAVYAHDDMKPWLYEKLYLLNLIRTR